MAQVKNTERRKRKYGDKQKTRTAHNKASRTERHRRRELRFEARTLDLVGRVVQFGSKAERLTGTVLEVVQRGDEGYPKGSKEHPARGRYLKIVKGEGEVLVRRKAVRLAA